MNKVALFFFALLFFPSFFFCQVSGAAYTCLGPFSLPSQNMGFINAFYSGDAEGNLVYAGSLYGGLWKGVYQNDLSGLPTWRWENITDTWPYPGTGISAVEVRPGTNAQTIYIGTQMGGNARLFAYGHGILKTTNGGKSWRQVGPPVKIEDKKEVDFFKMCPEDPDVMIARIGKEIFYTTNDWKNFAQLHPPIQNTDINMHLADVEWKPGDKKTFYLTTRCEAGVKGEFYATHDGGKTWTDMRHGVVAGNIQLDVVRKKGLENFIFMAHADNGAYLQVYDGKSWSRNRNSYAVFSGSGYWNMELEVNEEDTAVMYLSMTQVAKSKNGGRSFQTISEYYGVNTHADVRDMKILKATAGGKEDVVAMANDGGVSFSLPGTTDTKSWKNINGYGLAVSQFWGLGTSEVNPAIVMGGGQDNGLYTYNNGEWSNQTSGIGDGYDVCISDLDPAYAIGQGNSPGLSYTSNFGASWKGTQYPPQPCHLFRRPMYIDKSTHKFWIGHHQLYMKDNANGKADAKWVQRSFIPDIKSRSDVLFNSVVNSFAIGGKNGATGLMAYHGPIWQSDSLKGKLFYTTNLNDEKPEWKDITRLAPMLNWREIADMSIDPDDPDKFYLLWWDPYAGFASEFMQMEIIGNADSLVFTDLTGNLPKIPRNRFVMENNSGGTIYMATDSGIYVTNKEMLREKRWERFYSNEKPLPFCNISDMEINYASNRLYIATYGRGIWHTPLAETGGDQDIHVRKSVVWDRQRKIDGDVVVSAGKTLTISAPVYITSRSRIILRKKAKLIIKQPGRGQVLLSNDGAAYDISKIEKGKGAVVKTETN